MFKLLLTATGKIIEDNIPTEREAQRKAVAHIRALWRETPAGRRSLAHYRVAPGGLSWEAVSHLVVILPMVGDWIDIGNDEHLPEDTTDDDDLVFVTKKGEKHLGSYDAEEGRFICKWSERSWPSDKVVMFLMLPDAEKT